MVDYIPVPAEVVACIYQKTGIPEKAIETLIQYNKFGPNAVTKSVATLLGHGMELIMSIGSYLDTVDTEAGWLCAREDGHYVVPTIDGLKPYDTPADIMEMTSTRGILGAANNEIKRTSLHANITQENILGTLNIGDVMREVRIKQIAAGLEQLRAKIKDEL